MQAAKATSDYKREEYLAAALSGLVVTGVVASKLMANLEGKKAAAPGPARKKLGRMLTNCERRRDLGAVQLASRPLHVRRAQYTVAHTPSN